jgi:hypothetical protein
MSFGVSFRKDGHMGDYTKVNLRDETGAEVRHADELPALRGRR